MREAYNALLEICNRTDDTLIRNVRLKRNDFKQYLAKRYDNHISEKILNHFDLSNPWNYQDFVNSMELCLYQVHEFFYKITFEALDYNNDGYLSEVDLFLALKNIKDDELLKVLSFDLSKIIQFIERKKKDKGTYDEIAYKFKMLMKRRLSKAKVAKLEPVESEGVLDNQFFEFLTQALSSNPTAENSPNRLSMEETSFSNPKRMNRYGFDKRKGSTNLKSDVSYMGMSHAEGFGTSRLKKKNYFDLIYAFSEKDKLTEKLTLNEFHRVNFSHPIPNLMIDFIKYCTGYEMYKARPRPMKTPNFESLDMELTKLKKQLGKANYTTLVEGFLRLCANPEAILDSHWYITQESMHK